VIARLAPKINHGLAGAEAYCREIVTSRDNSALKSRFSPLVVAVDVIF
jgi:hypothetical protein